MECVSSLCVLMLLILLISNPKDSSYSGEIIIIEQCEHSIKIDVSFSEFQNNLSNDISIDILDLENFNRKYISFYDYLIDSGDNFMKRKTTMITTDCLLYLNYSQFYFRYAHHNITSSSGNIQIENDFYFSHYLYLAKFITKQPYQSQYYVCVKSYPKSSILISLMLLMCGDSTGSLINPGPMRTNVAYKCGICVNNIKTNTRFLTCNECSNKVHKKCVQANILNSYICNLCSCKLLPFDNIFDTDFDNDVNILGSNTMNSTRDRSNYNINAGNFECFKKKGLHFLHANARSIFHKLPELKLLAKQSNAAAIAITETWLDDKYTDACVSIDGYNLIRRDRDGHAGGVCAYIREDLAYNDRSDLNNPGLEDLWFEILLPKSKPLYIGVCYRTNNNTKCFTCLENTLSKLRSDCDLIVLGDFNVCLIKNKGKLGSSYKQLLNFFSCKQLIKEPTRITETSSSLLDHIFTNNSDKIYQSGVLNVGISDHLIIFCSRKIIRGQIGKHKTIKIRSLKKYSSFEFLNKLRRVDWSTVTNCTNVNEAWDKFQTIFFVVLDEVAPIKNIRIKNRTEPWMNSIILELIRERDKILYKSNKSKDDRELRIKFNSLRNKVQREIKKAKTNFFKDKIEENKDNPKSLWKQFKTLGYSSKSTNKSKIILDIDNNLCFEPKTNSDHMNNYFLNVASKLVNMLPVARGIFSTFSDLFKKLLL